MENTIQQIQNLQQNIEQILVQKQSLLDSLTQINKALTNITHSSTIYRQIGKIMIKEDYEDTKQRLTAQREDFIKRINLLEKKEQELRKELSKAQQKYLKLKNESQN